ncbi:MAG: endolytic transglycosylase MltG [Desulfosporosinus sp.]|jgi:UPF0755 protein
MSPKNKRKQFLMGIILVLLVGGIGLFSWWSWATEPYSATGNSVTINIKPGTTVTQLAEQLYEHNLIRSVWAFRLLVSAQDDFKIYAGDYLLSPAMPPDEIINHLLHSPLPLVTNLVTIPEGYTTEQIIDLLVQKAIGSKEEFIKVVTEDEFAYPFLKDAPKGIHRLEGYLFPNTYDIDKKTSPHAVVDMLLRQFMIEITPEVQKQLETLKLTVPQWVTIASLIEKEAVKESDRPLIASVIMNRLKINQPLQIDATIQFLLDAPKPKLYNKDLRIPSPYNTYLNLGLPPGPIANPGHASLQAALYPAQTDYFYYVAKADGYHVFSKTYDEHLKNVALYQ